MTEPRGKFPKEIDHVVFANHKEYKLCNFCVILVRTDRRLVNTRFPKEYEDTPEKRRKWLIREFNRLNPLESPPPADEPLLNPSGAESADADQTRPALYTTSCTACGKEIDVPAGKGGETVDCPHCGEKVELPFDAAEPQPAAETESSETQTAQETAENETCAENAVTCPGCGAVVTIPGGETAPCPHCGREIEAPLDFAD